MPLPAHAPPSPAAPPRRSFDDYDFPAYTFVPPHALAAKPLPLPMSIATTPAPKPAPAPPRFAHPAPGRARGPSFASTASCSSNTTASSASGSGSSSPSPATPPRGAHAPLPRTYRPYWERDSRWPAADDAADDYSDADAHAIAEEVSDADAIDDDDDDDFNSCHYTYGIGSAFGYAAYAAGHASSSPLAKHRSAAAARRSRCSPFADDDPLAPAPLPLPPCAYPPSPRSSLARASPPSLAGSASLEDASPLRTALLLSAADAALEPLPSNPATRRSSGLGLGLGLGLGGRALRRRKADWAEYAGDAFSHSYAHSADEAHHTPNSFLEEEEEEREREERAAPRRAASQPFAFAARSAEKRRQRRRRCSSSQDWFGDEAAVDLSDSRFSSMRNGLGLDLDGGNARASAFAHAFDGAAGEKGAPKSEHQRYAGGDEDDDQEDEEEEDDDGDGAEEDVPRCWGWRARWAALKLRVRLGAFRARRRVRRRVARA